MEKENLLGKIVDRIFSWPLEMIYSKEKRFARYVLILMVVGFVLRLVAALHEGVLADDMVYASQSAGILRSGLLSTHSNPPLFFYLTDLGFSLLGDTTFASRLWPLIAGVFLIPLVFLITRRFFNEKIAFVAAFFVTFSNFLVRMTFTEQSLVVLFFSMFGVYFGVKYLEERKRYWLILSAIGFGLGLLTKYNAPFFILAFLAYACFYLKSKKEKIFIKKNLRPFLIFLAILILFAIPFIAFNFFIYKDKGIVDVYFSRIIHVQNAQKIYGGLAGQERSFFDNVTMFSNYGNYNLLYKTDLIILIFGLVGIYLLFKKKEKNFLWFIALFFLIPFILQSAGAPLAKHFTFMPFLFSIPAGYALVSGLNKVNKRTVKIIILAVLAVVMIINLGTAYGTPANYFSESGESSLKSFINNNVDSSDLLVFDTRIYTAQTFWLATDKNFLILNQFPDFYQANKNLSYMNDVSTNVYFIKCVPEDCGWGTIASQQELNQSSEAMFDSIKNQTELVGKISENKYSGNEITGKNQEYIKYEIYKAQIPLNSALVQQTKQVQGFYFVPYLYLNMNNYLFSYAADGIYSLVNSLALIIIYLAMLFVAVLFAVVLVSI